MTADAWNKWAMGTVVVVGMALGGVTIASQVGLAKVETAMVTQAQHGAMEVKAATELLEVWKEIAALKAEVASMRAPSPGPPR